MGSLELLHYPLLLYTRVDLLLDTLSDRSEKQKVD
jgi:hypothetical protein